jgi:hypothetical protein
MTMMVLGRPLELPLSIRSRTAGRLKAEAHCLILGLLQFVQYEIIFLYDRF